MTMMAISIRATTAVANLLSGTYQSYPNRNNNRLFPLTSVALKTLSHSPLVFLLSSLGAFASPLARHQLTLFVINYTLLHFLDLLWPVITTRMMLSFIISTSRLRERPGSNPQRNRCRYARHNLIIHALLTGPHRQVFASVSVAPEYSAYFLMRISHLLHSKLQSAV
jgi:hypothetical protein